MVAEVILEDVDRNCDCSIQYFSNQISVVTLCLEKSLTSFKL